LTTGPSLIAIAAGRRVSSPPVWPLFDSSGPEERDHECASLSFSASGSFSRHGAAEVDELAMERAILSSVRGRHCFQGGYHYQNPSNTGGDLGLVSEGPMLQVPINRLLKSRFFTFVRYNDGEFYAMRDYYTTQGDWMCRNCDGLPCPREMVKSLIDALTDEKVLQLAPPHDMRYLVQASLYWEGSFGASGDIARHFPSIAFWVDDFVHVYSRSRLDLHEIFYAAVSKYNVTLVGPCNLRRLCHKIKYDTFVEIPVRHCNPAEGKATVARLVDLIGKQARESRSRVFLVSASMMTNAIAYRLQDVLLDRHFFIDIGSSLDIFLDASEGEKMVPKRVKGRRLEAMRGAVLHPNEETLKRLVGSKLYSNSSDAAAALRLWSVGNGSHDCYANCAFAPQACDYLAGPEHFNALLIRGVSTCITPAVLGTAITITLAWLLTVPEN